MNTDLDRGGIAGQTRENVLIHLHRFLCFLWPLPLHCRFTWNEIYIQGPPREYFVKFNQPSLMSTLTAKLLIHAILQLANSDDSKIKNLQHHAMKMHKLAVEVWLTYSLVMLWQTCNHTSPYSYYYSPFIVCLYTSTKTREFLHSSFSHLKKEESKKEEGKWFGLN